MSQGANGLFREALHALIDLSAGDGYTIRGSWASPSTVEFHAPRQLEDSTLHYDEIKYSNTLAI